MLIRRGVANTVFAGTTIVLLILAGVGFSLYLTSSSTALHTTTENMSHTTTAVMTETMNHTTTAVMTETMNANAIKFTPTAGQMFHSGWLLIEPTGTGQYAVSIHAEGLESTQSTGSGYLVEGAQSSGAKAVVPIGPNATASEFETSSTGVGNFFVVLGQNPFTTFENVQIVFLPGMSMTNATVVATAAV